MPYAFLSNVFFFILILFEASPFSTDSEEKEKKNHEKPEVSIAIFAVHRAAHLGTREGKLLSLDYILVERFLQN